MLTLLKSGWLASLVGALLYLGTTLLAWRPTERAATLPRPYDEESTAPTFDARSSEVDLLIEELKKEREALAERQTQLNELAERLRIERLELNQVTQMVHQAQAQLDSNVVRVIDEESVNLKKLARTYAGMSPENAALIFKQMEDPTLLKIISLMKESETAPILEAMAKQGDADAKRVAVISERLRLFLPTAKVAKRNM